MNVVKKYILLLCIECCLFHVHGQTTVTGTETKMPLAKEAIPKLYRSFLNVPYSRDDKENLLDAYIPLNYENSKVIVYLHGSGWTGGDKNEFPEMLINELAGKRKYILVSANYRLIKDGKNRFPSQMEDVSKLFSYLTLNAEKYHYKNDAFALMGGSAGAYLAMLYTYGYDSAKQVKTVVDFWGPTDLTDKAVREENKDANDKVVNLLGVTDSQEKICFEASPFYRVTKETGVPTILFHGGKDPLVHVSQADKMYKKLLSLDIPAQYEFYPNEGHGMKGSAGIDVFIKTLSWLNKYFPVNN